jgi:tetratricopeptide (TPR) repeat protein/transglutaminase-like putative cysteine protease
MTMRWMITAGVGMLASGAAQASDVPLYQPAPEWVKPAPPITPAQLTASSPIMVLFDTQQRLQNGQVWRYVDTATRVASAELLAQAGTVSLPWQPDKGDLIIHRVEIIRGAERIDLLAGGKRFTVIRREQQLEQRELNGELTATMAIEGLRIGDVIHAAMSITNTDDALGGNAQTAAFLPVAPARIGYVRNRLLWPAADRVQWKSYAEGATPVLATVGGSRELVVEGTLPKQPELPGDAPVRFQRPSLIEATSFADWAAVSKTMAPLYATNGLIAPGSPLAGEVARIKAAEADPMKRAALALSLVQDQVRYLYNGMGGGNYRPQKPADTWSLRYGDCKAKTLLLLALLHAMDVDAEAAIAPAEAGDLLSGRLPSPGAFDHVVVKATIGGETLWLDGTSNGTKLADLRDSPGFRTVLPLRVAGAEPMATPFRAPARPQAEVAVELDQRAGITLPSLVTVTMKLRGPPAAMLGLAATQASAEQQRAIAQDLVGKLVGEVRLDSQTITHDTAEGVATLTATGLQTTPWERDRGRRRLTLERAIGEIGFDPDRGRPAWRAIPVSLGQPEHILFRTRVLLPSGGKGYVLSGDDALAETIAGRAIKRRATIAGDVVTVEEESATVAAELPAEAIVATRARMALAKGRMLEAVAPAELPSHAVEATQARKAGLLKPMLASYARTIANDPDDKDVYLNRARFLEGVYDRTAAIPDVTKALEIEPAAATYRWRARLYELAGDQKRQLADLEEAMKLDPASTQSIGALAQFRLDRGEKDAALAMVQERIDAGGKEAPDFLAIKADLLARAGDKDGAIAAIDEAVVASPGNPSLLNSRCWIKGTLGVQLDTALKDCTRSIELSDSSFAALDSRAMVYFRMARYDDAMADLTAALDGVPDLAASLYLRGVILGKQGKADAGRGDVASARLIAPLIDRDYARWGIKP